MTEERLYESIKHIFTEPEIRALGADLAHEIQNLRNIQQQRQTAAKAFAAQIQETEGRIDTLSQQHNAGYKLVEVECLMLLNTPEAGMKRLVRIDTNEKVRDEQMTFEEKQGNFGFGEASE